MLQCSKSGCVYSVVGAVWTEVGPCQDDETCPSGWQVSMYESSQNLPGLPMVPSGRNRHISWKA